MGNYDDIINIPYSGSKRPGAMSMHQRAAQFAAFAALVGHDSMIAETARLTDEELEIADETIADLNRKMNCLKMTLHQRPAVTITYFLADERKSGGEYRTATGIIRKIDDYANIIVMEDGTTIPLQHILDLDSEIISQMEEF